METNTGQIITFYSYKGGTGRTMALANVACLLAEAQKRKDDKGVLMIDWDLEAPGLHRYFRQHIKEEFAVVSDYNSLNAPAFDSSHRKAATPKKGLIDLFYDLKNMLDEKKQVPNLSTRENPSITEDFSPASEKKAKQILDEIELDNYITATTITGLSLIKAGNFYNDDPNEYGERINTFDWEALYNKSPHLIRVFAEKLASLYAYVLIDSRTGVTDVSGICTTLLPEKLVIVFTPNIQSLQGGVELVASATEYRRESADLRPLMIYPLVSRVAAEEPELRNTWRFGNPSGDIPGFQPVFEEALAAAYDKTNISLNNYFDEIQIQHLPRFAYGEEIAVLADKTEDRFSMRRSYETFTNRLTRNTVPWEEQSIPLVSRQCFVIMGFGVKTDFATGRTLNLDKTYRTLIKPVLEKKGIVCRRADEISHSGVIDSVIFSEILNADIVIADISTANPNTLYQLGIRHALRPRTTIVIAESRLVYPFDLSHINIFRYDHLGENIDYDEVIRFGKVLGDIIDDALSNAEPDSPVYATLPSLMPPVLKITSPHVKK